MAGSCLRRSWKPLPAPEARPMIPSIITPELVESHGLTAEEYDRVRSILGREPNLTELGIFSAMWSEHCSYKSSKVHLATLPTKGPRVVQGPGEKPGGLGLGGRPSAGFTHNGHH